MKHNFFQYITAAKEIRFRQFIDSGSDYALKRIFGNDKAQDIKKCRQP